MFGRIIGIINNITSMKKVLSFLAGSMLMIPLMAGATVTPDVCDGQYVHEGGGDYSDSRMTVNIDHNTIISVAGATGYQVLEVFLSVEGDGHTGYWQYASEALSSFDPQGGDITGWKVRVKKVCEPPVVDVCPNIVGAQATMPEGKELVDGQCVDIVVVPPPLTCETGFHVSGEVCVIDEVTPVPEPTPTPEPETTPTPPISNPGGRGGAVGGHRHCDVPGTPSCAELASGVATPVLGSSDLKVKLLDLMNQLVGLLRQKLAGMDGKGY
jgi:hypothetical protein